MAEPLQSYTRRRLMVHRMLHASKETQFLSRHHSQRYSTFPPLLSCEVVRQISKVLLQRSTLARDQEDMLGKVNEGDWSVLVMDPEATKIMSAVCRVSEILNFGVACALHARKPYQLTCSNRRYKSSRRRHCMHYPGSTSLPRGLLIGEVSETLHICVRAPPYPELTDPWLQHSAVVEDLFKNREPALNAAGIYFLTPSDASVQRLLEEWSGPATYGTAHIFFTSKVAPHQLAALKGCSGLIDRLRTLAEVGTCRVQCNSGLRAQVGWGVYLTLTEELCNKSFEQSHVFRHRPSPTHASRWCSTVAICAQPVLVIIPLRKSG